MGMTVKASKQCLKEFSEKTDELGMAVKTAVKLMEDYDAKLKDDMKIILFELVREIEEYDTDEDHDADLRNGTFSDGLTKAASIIRERIDKIDNPVKGNAKDTATKKLLSDIKEGQSFSYGGIVWVALDKDEHTTFAIAADIIDERQFDDYELDTKRVTWQNSTLREHLNNDFIKTMIENGASSDAFCKMKIDLTTDVGTNNYGTDEAQIALLTSDQYRKYRDIIPSISSPWWLATPYSSSLSHYIASFITPENTISYTYASYGYLGVRPTCLLSSDITVEVKESEDTDG